MTNKTRRSSIFREDDPTPCLPRPACSPRPRTRGRGPRAGQAYTEYLIVLFFGVFLCLGVVIADHAADLHLMDRLYGYIFDYYAGIANFLSLPTF
jgi:hypothetical protein